MLRQSPLHLAKIRGEKMEKDKTIKNPNIRMMSRIETKEFLEKLKRAQQKWLAKHGHEVVIYTQAEILDMLKRKNF
jgi:hypothetical protein